MQQGPNVGRKPEDETEVSITRSEVGWDGFVKVDLHSFSHRRFDGTMSAPMEREILRKPPAVAMLPYDPVLDEVLIIHQFRIAAHLMGRKGNQIEVPAGMVDPHKDAGEDGLRAAAVRELSEESGLVVAPEALIAGPSYLPTPGNVAEIIHTYLAPVSLSQAGGIHGLQEEGEDIRVERIAAAEAFAMLERGEIEFGPAVTLLLWFQGRYASLRKQLLEVRPHLARSDEEKASSGLLFKSVRKSARGE